MAFQSIMTDLTGKSSLEYEDPRWGQLFHSKQILQLHGDENVLESMVDRFIDNNVSTGNLTVLLSHTSSKIRQVLDRQGQTSSTSSKNVIEQCCIAMHLTCLLFNSFFSKLTSTALKKQLFLSEDWPFCFSQEEEKEGRPKKAVLQTGDQVLKELIDEILEVLSLIGPPAWMYDTTYYAANLLLSMFTTQLFREKVEDGGNIILAYVYAAAESELQNLEHSQRGVEASMPGKFLKSIIAAAVAVGTGTQQPPSAGLVKEVATERKASRQKKEESSGTNPVMRFLETLYSFIPGTADSRIALAFDNVEGVSGQLIGTPRHSAKYSLQEKLFSSFMILLYNRKNHERGNPFREVFRMLQDVTLGEDEEQAEGLELVSLLSSANKQQMISEHVIFVDFRGLAESMTYFLPSETSTLFFYALLNIHPSFIDHLTASRCIEPVFCATLRGLYDSNKTACVDHLYVLVINVLVVVQDKLLRQSLSQMKAIAPWYSEHKLRDISVSDLTMLCTLRCTLHALFKLKDSYLLSNCFAVMLDLVPVLQGVDIYVAERIVKVIIQLAKRSVTTTPTTSTSNTSTDSSPMTSLLAESEKFEDISVTINARETLGVLLKVCILALRPSKRRDNVHLLYALIHEYEKLKSVFTVDVAVDEAKVNASSGDSFVVMAFMQQKELLQMTKHYLDSLNLDKETTYVSAVAAVNMLRSVLAKEDLSAEEDPKRGMNFSYAEEESADAFFVPCVWAAMVRSSEEVEFSMQRTTLFSPIDKRLLTLKP